MPVELSKQSSRDSSVDRNNSIVVAATEKHVVSPEHTSVTTHHSSTTHHDAKSHATMYHGGAHSAHSAHSGHHAMHGGHHVVAHSAHSGYSAHQGGRIVSTVTGEARETGQSHIIATRTGEKRYTGESRVLETIQGGSHQISTRVVGHETGPQRQVSVTEVELGEEIIGERTMTTGKGRRGRKIIREEVIEKVIVVPETVQIEEWVEDEYDMQETVIEVAKKYQIEKIVEVAEIEIVEKVIEQIEKVIREKIVEIPVIQTVEKIVEVPVIQTVEKIVEVPEIQYRDIPVEKIVEVPEYKTEEVIREVKRAKFVDKPVEQKKLIVDSKVHKRRLPVPVEAETIVEFTVPHLRANYVKKKFPVYLPRFIEVPVSRQFVDAEVASMTDKYAGRLANLISVKPAVSLCEIEGLASEMKVFYDKHNIHNKKTQIGGVVSESHKREMFSKHTMSLEKYAAYRHLPVEVASLHFGHQHSLTHSSEPCITYSSHSFGIHTSTSHSHAVRSTPAVGYSTEYHTSTHATHALPSTHSNAYAVGHAIGSTIRH